MFLILLLRLRITWKYVPVFRWHIHISVLLVIGVYMVLSFFVENMFVDVFCFLLSLSIIMLLNRDFLREAFAVYRKMKE